MSFCEPSTPLHAHARRGGCVRQTLRRLLIAIRRAILVGAMQQRKRGEGKRVPGGRLPARRKALYNLGTLQLRLMAEGRDADAAICTNAMFVIQEMLARVDQLAHTAE